MADIPMTFACGLYDRMSALHAGEVRPEGIDLDFIAINDPREIFDRMAGGQAFDASEMSASEYICRFAADECPFVALPAFPSRVFRHGFIAVDTRVIKKPADLAGKRIGVALYTMTAAVWIRSLLHSDLGLDLSGVEWVEGAMNAPGPHGSPTVLPVLAPLNITPNTSGKSLSDLLAEGEIHAAIGANLPNCLGKTPHVARLFPDYVAEEKAYWRRTRIFPIMHLVVVRHDFHERHPTAAASLYDALERSRILAYERMRYFGALRYMLPWLPAEIEEIDSVFGGDPWPYGIEPNRPTLEGLVRALVDQSMIAAPVPVDDLFVPVGG